MRDYCKDALDYAKDVVSGKLVAGRWVRLACQRQLDDSERTDWRYRFDRQRAEHVCFFVENLPHVEGRWGTANIVLQPWQCWVLTTIFGWVDAETGYRRYRKALIVMARKNAKTTLGAAMLLYLLCADGEPGAKLYSAATTRDQAKLSWGVAQKFVQRTPGLRRAFGVQAGAHAITVESTGGAFKALSRDSDSLEGLNPHGWLVDELHAHKTREVFDVLDEATGARQQPLGIIISTEGEAAEGVFPEQVTYGQIQLQADPAARDETYFAAYYAIDPEDDWVNPACWIKANPNLGVSVFLHDMETRCKQAQANAESQASFLTKRLNVRVGAGNAYFNMLAWHNRCKDSTLKLENFYGWPVVMALDLASTKDVASKVYLFWDAQHTYAFARHYIPSDAIERGRPNYASYRAWADAGYLTITEGSSIDYEAIEQGLKFDRDNFELRSVGYDPWNATQLAQRMDKEGLPMNKVQQSVLMLNEPMKELANRIRDGRIKHDGDPVLSWMVGNVMAKIDVNENVFPRKARPDNKIDGAVALIMATREQMHDQGGVGMAYDGLAIVG